MKEITIDAITENVTVVTDFVNSYLKEQGCPDEIIVKLDIAIDELFSNIANYSYGNQVGSATVRVSFDATDCMVTVTFVDEGIAYNPLEKEDPDTSEVLEDDTIGGLGIFITKSLMDDIQYRYDDGKNILIIYKKTSGR